MTQLTLRSVFLLSAVFVAGVLASRLVPAAIPDSQAVIARGSYADRTVAAGVATLADSVLPEPTRVLSPTPTKTPSPEPEPTDTPLPTYDPGVEGTPGFYSVPPPIPTADPQDWPLCRDVLKTPERKTREQCEVK